MVADPYTVLGVDRQASQDDIRAAYRRLAKKHHPDLNPGNAAAEARFKEVSAANDILSDVEKRRRFDAGEIDAEGHESGPPPGYRAHAESDAGRRYAQHDPAWDDADYADLLRGMFRDANRRRDRSYTLTVGFLDAVNGATKRITLPDGAMLDVRIPPGTEPGQTLRLRGKGEAGGDALVEIQTTPHRFFTRDGQDIRVDLPITLKEAVLGAKVDVPTPRGPVRMNIPPHSDTGAVLRLRGRGVPASGGKPEGNLLATLRIVLGPTDAALEDFLRGWTPASDADPRAALGEP